MNTVAATASWRSQPDATHSPSPTTGTHANSSAAGPYRWSHATPRLATGLGNSRPIRYDVMPPSVLPTVATASAGHFIAGASLSSASSTISELPGSSVADRNDEA